MCACRNYEDAYTDPGSPSTRKTKWNTYVLAQLDDQQKLLLEGTLQQSSQHLAGLQVYWNPVALEEVFLAPYAITAGHVAGSGASPEGNRPFVDILELSSGNKQRIWQSKAPYYESPGMLLNDMDPTQPIRYLHDKTSRGHLVFCSSLTWLIQSYGVKQLFRALGK